MPSWRYGSRDISAFIPRETSLRADVIDFRLLGGLVVASLPALLLGLWAVGSSSAGAEGRSVLQAIALGAQSFLPRLTVAGVTSLVWAVLFARFRGRDIDPGWLYSAWFFSLLLPAATPLALVAAGLSFGLVFGCHAFGGTARYIVSPVILGVVFLTFAWPSVMNSHWLPGIEATDTWTIAATGGAQALAASGVEWVDAALGREVAAVGVPSAMLCFAAVLFLVFRRLASLRIVAGGLIGLLAVAALFETVPWYWQPVLGNFAFVLAFVATDPTLLPESRPARWLLGLVFGALTVVLRMLNPEHPEGSLSALLLALLIVPVVDYWAARPAAPVRTTDRDR